MHAAIAADHGTSIVAALRSETEPLGVRCAATNKPLEYALVGVVDEFTTEPEYAVQAGCVIRVTRADLVLWMPVLDPRSTPIAMSNAFGALRTLFKLGG